MYQEFHQNLPIQIREWLNARAISNPIINNAKIGWNGTAITIPIFDVDGNFSFFKYRKDPDNKTEGPKYWYEKGHDAMLYRSHLIKNAKQIFITEGEFDSLVLASKGISAVSSTGGAGTFPDEWVDILRDREVFICYDYDDAGRKGSIRLMQKLPWARLILLPAEIGNHGDVTDYFVTMGKEYGDFVGLAATAKAWPIFKDAEGLTDLEEMRQYYNKHLAPPIKPSLQWLGNAFLKHYDEQLYNLRSKPASTKHTDDDVKNAKAQPTENYYKGKLKRNGGRLFGICPVHTEKSGSFVIYSEQKKWHCFGCGARGDTIDLVMATECLSFKEAVKFINGT